MKRFLAMTLTLAMVTTATPVFASQNLTQNDLNSNVEWQNEIRDFIHFYDEEGNIVEIKFVDNPEDVLNYEYEAIVMYINSNGDFTFNVNNFLRSSSFTVTNNSSTIRTRAVSTGTSQTFNLSLFGPGQGLTGTGHNRTANGLNEDRGFSNMTVGANYHFEIAVPNATQNVTGNGNVSNIGPR
jgi:hypothetical protein